MTVNKPTNQFLSMVIDDAGYADPQAIAKLLNTNMNTLANITGLAISSLRVKERSHDNTIQLRLYELVCIISRITPWCGNVIRAYAWYRSELIPSFGDRTTEALVKEGKADAVHEYLERIGNGGYS